MQYPLRRHFIDGKAGWLTMDGVELDDAVFCTDAEQGEHFRFCSKSFVQFQFPSILAFQRTVHACIDLRSGYLQKRAHTSFLVVSDCSTVLLVTISLCQQDAMFRMLAPTQGMSELC